MLVGISLWITTKENSDPVTIMFARVLAINPTLIFIVSVWKGVSKPVDRWEVGAFLFSLVAILFWFLTKDNPGLTPTLLAIFADICALVPTLVFLKEFPAEDRPFAWACFTIGSILAIAGVEHFNIENLILPVYMGIGSLLVVIPLVKYRIKNNVPLRNWI